MKLLFIIAISFVIIGTSLAQLFGNGAGGGSLNGGGNFVADQTQVWAKAVGGFLGDQQNLFARASGNLGLNGGGGNSRAGGLNLGGNLGGLFSDPRTGRRMTR